MMTIGWVVAFQLKPGIMMRRMMKNPTVSKMTPQDMHVQDLENTLQEVARNLQAITTRFYMYDHPNITMVHDTSLLNLRPRRMPHMNEVKNDAQILLALGQSPLRTYNPNEAELFIVTTPMTLILMSRSEDYDTPMNHLVYHEEPFRKHQGNKHVIVSGAFPLFRTQHQKNTRMRGWYGKIWNVTVFQSWDPSATYNSMHSPQNATWGTWQKTKDLGGNVPLTKRSVSLGLGSSNEQVGLIPASVEKFRNSSNFVFYHSRSLPSFNNSTIFRHAPITNITLDSNFPKSSIGWDIEKEAWERNFTDSKFCLIIRGDSPHSHALWRSIRVGCIPVIAADVLPIFSPMYKNTLQVEDYAVVLNEEELVSDPTKTLLQLNDMSEEEIRLKLKHLAFAQRVIFTDHPQSLFVPAFLKEAEMASVAKM